MTASREVASEHVVRRLARFALTVAVRGRRANGGPWGEAILAEFAQTCGQWEAIRWAFGGIRAALQERRAAHRELPRRVRIRRRAIRFVLTAGLAAFVLQQWVLTFSYQPSPAMAPTLQTSDYFLSDRIGFRLIGLDRGDIVVYQPSDDPGGTAIRRVIGLPGDRIDCRAGLVVRNGAEVGEPYLPADCIPTIVPDGSVYLLADNRAMANQTDPVVDADQVQGRMVARLWNGGPESWLAPPARSDTR
ncbi:signal peptidase I [Micromonospora sp. C95]|uniref:signal peptidase I n=1 Tax=Micromonospora sp. C95 TaxID=2824882 RepID=UPI001B36CA3F|nr:signal peptidase I [Micromonospora sp. C95]MBQ1023965.1 signal peptidase I [Micromonospora sp. C95]